MQARQNSSGSFFKLENFVPSLRAGVEKHPFNISKLLRAGIPVPERGGSEPPEPSIPDRQAICVTDGTNVFFWKSGSLQSLFRGSQQPPELGDTPDVYNETFALVDAHVLEISNVMGDRRDAEMEEIYSALRRRPDGKSTGVVHDYMWQAAAIALGVRPLSEAEFKAIMARLERSCRTFGIGVASRNYVAALRETFAGGLEGY